MKHALIALLFSVAAALAGINALNDVNIIDDANILLNGEAEDQVAEGAYYPPSGMRAWWEAHEFTNASGKVVDSSGNDITGTPGTGGAAPSWSNNYGGEFIFDGGDVIYYSDNAAASATAVTFRCWARSDAPANLDCIFGDSAGANLFMVSGTKWRIRKDYTYSDYGNTVTTNWTHLVLTWNTDDDYFRLYENATQTIFATNASATWTILPALGHRGVQTGWGWDGIIDDILWYDDREWGQAAIDADYEGTQDTYEE